MGPAEDRAWGRALAALVTTVVLLVAIPVALVAAARERFGSSSPWAGVPAPWRWDAGAIGDALGGRTADSTIADVVIRVSLSVAWVAVLAVAVSIVVEVVHQLRHGGIPTPSVRGLGWSQGVARFVAAGLLVLVSHQSSIRLPAPALAVGPAFAGATSGLVVEASPGARATAPRPAIVDHVVEPGESVYAIAGRLASGVPARTAEIADAILDLNLGRTMRDGGRFTNAAYLEPGWVLQVPLADGARPSPVETPVETPGSHLTGSAAHHVVVEGETLWSIAAERLDDPHRWTEIWDLHAGDSMGDGRTFADPDLIVPGWQLELPNGTAPADVPPPVEVPVEVPVETRPVADPAAESASELASETEVDRIVWDGSPPRTVMPEPDDTPAAPATMPAEPATMPAAPATPIAAATPVAAATPIPAATPADGSGERRSIPTGLGGAAMLSAGILALVAAHRRRRLRAAPIRARLPVPAVVTTETERVLRTVGHTDRLLRLDLAVRALAADLLDPARYVVAATIRPGGDVAVLLDGTASLPEPWTGGERRWSLPASVDVDSLAARSRAAGMPCVALIQLGVTADGEELYVDLEALGHFDIVAAPDRADAVVAAIAATLGSSVFAEVAHLIGVGLPVDAFLGHPAATSASSIDDALDLARSLVGRGDAGGGGDIGADSAGRRTTAFDLRRRAVGGERWEPAIVLATSRAVGSSRPVPPSSSLALVTSASGASCASGVAIEPGARLVDLGTHWELTLAHTGVEAGAEREPIALRPIGLDPDEQRAIVELVEEARQPVDNGADDAIGEVRDDTVRPTPPEWSVRVGLLGPVAIVNGEGAAATFPRSKARELVAWLATHRQRSTRSAARTALWELDVRDATFANVVSEARRTLARLAPPPDGVEWVGRTLTDDLPLHERVVTDVDLMAWALEAARGRPPEVAVAVLTPAVELIRGMPFEGTTYLWPDAEGLTSNLVLTATSAAAELARLHLQLGDVDGVFRATGRGLLVLPGHEELIGLRMRAHAWAGDLAGVRHEWASYERVVHADPWSDGELAPKLVALRHELLTAAG